MNWKNKNWNQGCNNEGIVIINPMQLEKIFIFSVVNMKNSSLDVGISLQYQNNKQKYKPLKFEIIFVISMKLSGLFNPLILKNYQKLLKKLLKD